MKYESVRDFFAGIYIGTVVLTVILILVLVASRLSLISNLSIGLLVIVTLLKNRKKLKFFWSEFKRVID